MKSTMDQLRGSAPKTPAKGYSPFANPGGMAQEEGLRPSNPGKGARPFANPSIFR